ncbi:MAG: hypothetical protein MI757_19000, partial [Pirellulales bacterium]|nr:hypothetical protein [Pirellulales bacterium]
MMYRITSVWLVLSIAASVCGEERHERFDREPGWDGFQNRSARPQKIRQDFGYSPTNHAGGRSGEIGGYISPAAEPAYYARAIEPTDFDQPLRATGRFAATSRRFHVLLAFFHTDTVNEWRTPNTIALRIMGRGDYFYAYVEYCTSRWRAGGDRPQPFGRLPDPTTSRMELVEFPLKNARYEWSMEYDPQANGGNGAIFAQLGDVRAVCHLDPGHKADGARFNRFGIMPVLKQYDDGGEVWLDDVEINGQLQTFDADPNWEGRNNHRQYSTMNVRPRFDFGFSATNHAGGAKAGELGGLVFRGDCRKPGSRAYYGDRIGPLTLAEPLQAAGQVALRRGVTDSTSLLGFFHSQKSTALTDSQQTAWPMNFLGVAVEGPSSEGLLLYPAYRA